MSGHTLLATSPAARWEDAFPCGNGTVGALMYGGVWGDSIVFNHHGLFLPSHDVGPLNDISECFREVRRLALEGRYDEAQRYWFEVGPANGYEICTAHDVDPLIPMCALKIRNREYWVSNKLHGKVGDYSRSLDMEAGVSSVSWKSEGAAATNWGGVCARYSRELFVSGADDIAVYRIKASAPGKLDYDFALIPQPIGESHDAFFTEIPFECSCAVTGEYMTYAAKLKNGTEFGAAARVMPSGGPAHAEGDYLAVRGAGEITVLVKFFLGGTASERIPALIKDLSGIRHDYDVLLERHTGIHGELFGRVRLDLPSDPEVCKIYELGRHMLISSSRGSSYPATIQGLWNGEYWPLWDSDYHTDENIQMTYWQALPGAMPETALPYFDYFESRMDGFRENAQKLFGCRGIYLPMFMTSTGRNKVAYFIWIAGGAWIAQLFYDYWLFTGDTAFLKNRAIPFMREAAMFYEDYLIMGVDGKLTAAPSFSPENCPRGSTAYMVTDATMDIAVIKELLTSLCAVCGDEAARWGRMLAGLPGYAVGRDGALKEWLGAGFHNNDAHRHLSHLYPLFPGYEITGEDEPALFAAAGAAMRNRRRGNEGDKTSWYLAHSAAVFARLGDGDSALACLKEMINGYSFGGGFFKHMRDFELFQADANYGFTAAVQEMLVFSMPGMIKLLPALPAAWRRGSAAGLRCRGGIRVSLAWDMDEGRVDAFMTSAMEQELAVKLPFGGYKTVVLKAGAETRIE